MKRGFCVLLTLLLSAAATVAAQTYRLMVSVPLESRAALTLNVYEGGSVKSQTVKSRDGLCEFSGRIQGAAAYAELSQEGAAQPLSFFIENTDISVRFDAANPPASPIVGSRSNSRFRYALECGGGHVDSLAAYAMAHPDEVYTPYLLYRYVAPSLQRDALGEAVERLQGQARQTHHYALLQRRLERMDSLAVGCPMPDFRYVDSLGKECSFRAVWKEGSPALLYVAASWCLPQRQAPKGMQQVVVRIDDQPKGWQAPLVSQLLVDHVPYLILVDSRGRIAATDVRRWELERELEKLK